MKQFDWNGQKNRQIIEGRGISFEEVVFHIQSGDLLDDIAHPNTKDYPHQRMFIVKIKSYAYLVPYVESEEDIFLKTIIPSRKATKKYIQPNNE